MRPPAPNELVKGTGSLQLPVHRFVRNGWCKAAVKSGCKKRGLGTLQIDGVVIILGADLEVPESIATIIGNDKAELPPSAVTVGQVVAQKIGRAHV